VAWEECRDGKREGRGAYRRPQGLATTALELQQFLLIFFLPVSVDNVG
jgi:hypothetical protein